jgi:hypothetical protein
MNNEETVEGLIASSQSPWKDAYTEHSIETSSKYDSASDGGMKI